MPDEQRTEPPTPRRLQRARREGDHPVSRVLVGLGALAVAAMLLPKGLELLVAEARRALRRSLELGQLPHDLPDAAAASAALAPLPAAGALPELARSVMLPVLLLLGPAALAALLAGAWQTGAGLSLHPLAWNVRRLQPLDNLSRLWSRTTLFALLRWFASAAVLALLAFQLLRAAGPALAASVGSVRAALLLAGQLCQQLLWWGLGVLAFGALLDVLVVRSAWLARLRMTREEVQRERRENEGDLGLQRARQRVQRELAQHAQLAELGRALLLVVGRPRSATALTYDAAQDAAPRVLMQASGKLAQTLEQLAPGYGVPVHEDAELARALAGLEPEDPIPAALYAGVASAVQAARRAQR
jgi:flagellar biosynthesis protein FlhB